MDHETPSTPATSEQILLAPIARLLLTPTEAAAILRISPRLLWTKTKQGQIPSIKIGKCVRYSPSALKKWIESSGSDR
jgi:excisionase family DNA binding protein